MKQLFFLIIIFSILSIYYIDKRDNTKYSIFKIDETLWLKENLKYIFKDTINTSFKIENKYPIYGTYYTLNSAKIACPEGFRLASLNDYKKLLSKLKGETNSLQGKRVIKKELEKYGFLLGGG